jgi:hypothetical protein
MSARVHEREPIQRRQQKSPFSGAFEEEEEGGTLQERMMGFEPTTFCMASGSWVRPDDVQSRIVERIRRSRRSI